MDVREDHGCASDHAPHNHGSSAVLWESDQGCQWLWGKDLQTEKAAAACTTHDNSHGNNVGEKP
jgi:hypothetical protein